MDRFSCEICGTEMELEFADDAATAAPRCCVFCTSLCPDPLDQTVAQVPIGASFTLELGVPLTPPPLTPTPPQSPQEAGAVPAALEDIDPALLLSPPPPPPEEEREAGSDRDSDSDSDSDSGSDWLPEDDGDSDGDYIPDEEEEEDDEEVDDEEHRIRTKKRKACAGIAVVDTKKARGAPAALARPFELVLGSAPPLLAVVQPRAGFTVVDTMSEGAQSPARPLELAPAAKGTGADAGADLAGSAAGAPFCVGKFKLDFHVARQNDADRNDEERALASAPFNLALAAAPGIISWEGSEAGPWLGSEGEDGYDDAAGYSLGSDDLDEVLDWFDRVVPAPVGDLGVADPVF